MKFDRKLLSFLCIAFLLGLSACFPTDPNQLERIPLDRAIEIAKEDAVTVYPDLSIFEIVTDTVPNRWQIDFVSQDTSQVKEGPHYLIANRGGKIIMKHYPQ